MQSPHHIIAATLVSFSSMFLGASCLQEQASTEDGLVYSLPTEPTDETQEAIKKVTIDPKNFVFVTKIPYSGNDAGGEQEARAVFEFKQQIRNMPERTWTCSLAIAMPLRTRLRGVITPQMAAEFSARVTTAVANEMNYNLAPGVFCVEFKSGVRQKFPAYYPFLGVRFRE